MSDQPTEQKPVDVQATPPETVPDKKDGQQGEPAWLPERLERARRTAQADLLKSLGVDSADELKSFFDEARKLKEEKMSDSEKTAAALKKLEDRASAAELKAAELETARRDDRINAAITRQALDAKAQHPEDVIDWIRKSGADMAKLLKDDGAIDDKAVTGLIAKAKESRPTWFAIGGPGSPSNRGGKTPEPDANERAALARQQFNKIIGR